MVVGEPTLDTQVLIIGSGPGGYAAAFRAADLGLDVTMVSLERKPGGVCLYQGCIPSKTLLYISQLLYDTRRASALGLTFGQPQIDLAKIRAWKDQVIGKLTGGLVNLSKRRDVQFITARATFDNSDRVRLEGADLRFIRFQHAILATGSYPTPFPDLAFRAGGRVMDSTAALALPDIPKTLLVVGGGYVGLELGSVYAVLGSKVTLVELTDGLLPGADRDLARILSRRLEETFAEIRLSTRVTALEEHGDRVDVILEGAAGEERRSFDRVLVAMGRRPNTAGLDLETTGVKVDGRGFVLVDEQQRTSDPKIMAVGDVVGGALLAHKAMREGKVAAEVIAGQPSACDVRAIPCVVYTDPQVAWCGLTETEAGRSGRSIEIARFPWGASGRATTLDASEGLTKVLFDPESKQVLGVGIVGREAGELIAEGVLAVEMAAVADDLALIMHPHPTLSETVGEAAEVFLGSPTHILPLRR